MVSRALGSFVVAASLMFVGVAEKPAAADVHEQPVAQVVSLVVQSVDLVAGTVDVLVGLDIIGVEDVVEVLVEDVLLSLVVTGQDEGECSILDLTLGPIHLDLLGLVVHLDDCNDGFVEVRIYAEPGEGVLGDLLCGLLGGLDIGGILGDLLSDLLLNDLLGLADLDAVAGEIRQILQALLDEFLMTAEPSNGNGNGGPPAHAGRQGPPDHAPAHGRRAGAGPPDHAPAHGRRRQDAPDNGDNGDNGNDVNGERCDILFLRVEKIHVALLGLNVETMTPICLDVYAVPGADNLLGNLLCAVVGLLDSPGDRLGQLLPLLGEIRDLLGELGLLEDL